jgi:putative flippase GtrA
MCPALKPEHHLALGRVLRFVSVGLLATAAYYAILCVLVEVLAVGVLLATSVAFVVVTVENYFLHYHWTFRSKNRHARAFPAFLSMNVVGFGMNWATMFVGTQVLNLNYLLVQAVAIAAIVLWNFIASSLWIFGSLKA